MSVFGPGEYLAEAREALRLSHEDVANQLNLTPATIEALENNDYELLPGITFARGYLRGYARLLGLDEEQILRLCRSSDLQDPFASALASRSRISVRPLKNPRPLILSSLLAVCVLGYTAWWVFESKREAGLQPLGGWLDGEPSVEAEIQPQSDAVSIAGDRSQVSFASESFTGSAGQTTVRDLAAAQRSQSAPGSEAQDSGSAQAEPGAEDQAAGAAAASAELAETLGSAASPAPAEEVEPGQAAQPAAFDVDIRRAPSAASVGQADDIAPVAPASSEPAQIQFEQTTAVQAEETQAGDPEPPALQSSEPAGSQMEETEAPQAEETPSVDRRREDELVIRTTGPSWVEIFDADNERLVFDMLAQGDVQRVSGRAPFKVVVGNAPVVELEYLGEPVDLTAVTRASKTAQLTVGAAIGQ